MMEQFRGPAAGEDVDRWIVIAAFFKGAGDRWLDDFVEDPRLSFEKVPPPRRCENWHAKKSPITSLADWLTHLRHARVAYRRRPDGLVTCFPQLAMCSAIWKRLGRANPPIIAYNYNLGRLRPSPRQWLARWVARQIDIYVVHAPQEVESYAAYLGVSPSRVRFVPLQRGRIEIPRAEDAETPFLLAMGSAGRDYPTLISAVDRLGIPTTIVTRKADIAHLPRSPHVTFLSGLSERDCLELLARARICVTPIANQETASGQITVINAMQLGVPVIATRCPGTDGYVEDGRTGLCVEPFDIEDMTAAIERLWSYADLRARFAERGRAEALARFSDEAAAAKLRALICEVGGR